MLDDQSRKDINLMVDVARAALDRSGKWHSEAEVQQIR